jgi:transcriptional regulator with XRE-family HTH domain
MTIGENIKRLREERHMSQLELARAAGYKDRSSISRIEGGDNDPTQKSLAKIAIALGVRPYELFPAFVNTMSADEAPTAASLTTEELMLVKAYREAKESYQALAMELLVEHKKEE